MALEATLAVICAIVIATTAGLIVARRMTRAGSRTPHLVRAAFPDAEQGPDGAMRFTTLGRPIGARAHGKDVRLSTPIQPPPMPWRQAARALGNGQVLALLAAPEFVLDETNLTLCIPSHEFRGASLRKHAERLADAARALEELPLDLALARYLLDHASPTELLPTFVTLVQRFPDAPATLQCARTCAEDADRATLAEAARTWLDQRPPVADPSPDR